MNETVTDQMTTPSQDKRESTEYMTHVRHGAINNAIVYVSSNKRDGCHNITTWLGEMQPPLP